MKSKIESSLENLEFHSSTLKDLDDTAGFSKFFLSKCKKTGLHRYMSHKSINKEIDELNARDLTDYCGCSLDKLKNKTVFEIQENNKDIEQELSTCVKKLHSSQRTRSMRKASRASKASKKRKISKASKKRKISKASKKRKVSKK